MGNNSASWRAGILMSKENDCTVYTAGFVKSSDMASLCILGSLLDCHEHIAPKLSLLLSYTPPLPPSILYENSRVRFW